MRISLQVLAVVFGSESKPAGISVMDLPVFSRIVSSYMLQRYNGFKISALD